MDVRFERVTKRYPAGGSPAVNEVDLHIGGGDWIFLVGPSGAGKSTVLKLLYAEERPDDGRVFVDGVDVATVPSFRLRRRMGIVFQTFELLPVKTATENVAYAAEVLGVPPGEARRRAHELLDLVGLVDKLERLPQELSGGEQQRVAIARALIHRPRLIVADEPTGDLDPDSATVVMNILEKVHREWDVTVLLVTHAADIVNRMGRRVVRLEDGRIVADRTGGYAQADAVERR